MLDETQKDELRVFGMDREQSKGKNRAGAAPLKVRPVIVKDLSIFGTPRS